MKRTVVMLTLALAVGIALGLIGSQVLDAQQMPIKRTVLLKTDLPGIEGKEFLARPGGAGPRGGWGEALSPRECVRLYPGRRWGLAN